MNGDGLDGDGVQEADGLHGDRLAGDGAGEAHEGGAEGLASSGLGRMEEAAPAGWLSSTGLACVRGFFVGLALASLTVIATDGSETVGGGSGDVGRRLRASVMSKSGRLSELH